jgi:hypothetical protein
VSELLRLLAEREQDLRAMAEPGNWAFTDIPDSLDEWIDHATKGSAA